MKQKEAILTIANCVREITCMIVPMPECLFIKGKLQSIFDSMTQIQSNLEDD